MQTHTTDHYPRQAYRLGLRHGGDRTDFPYLILDIEQRGRRLPGGKLVGNGPAGVVAGVARPLLQHQVVYLHDHPVDLVGVVFPLRLPLPAEVRRPPDVGSLCPLIAGGRHLEAQFGQDIEGVRMGRQGLQGIVARLVRSVAEAVNEGLQVPVGHLRRGLHAQAPRSRVAGVSVEGKPCGRPGGIHAFEAVFTDDHLTPQLHAVESVATKGRL